jgi:hypothetical protein
MYKHITNGLNNMSYEDFWWDTYNEIERLGLRKKFDKQVEKMQHQEKHKYKDTKQIWEYALNKIRE